MKSKFLWFIFILNGSLFSESIVMRLARQPGVMLEDYTYKSKGFTANVSKGQILLCLSKDLTSNRTGCAWYRKNYKLMNVIYIPSNLIKLSYDKIAPKNEGYLKTKGRAIAATYESKITDGDLIYFRESLVETLYSKKQFSNKRHIEMVVENSMNSEDRYVLSDIKRIGKKIYFYSYSIDEEEPLTLGYCDTSRKRIKLEKKELLRYWGRSIKPLMKKEISFHLATFKYKRAEKPDLEDDIARAPEIFNTNTHDVKVFSKQSLKSSIVESLSIGEMVEYRPVAEEKEIEETINGDKSLWTRVIAPSKKIGYIWGGYLTSMFFTTLTEIPLNAEPRQGSIVYLTIPINTRIIVLATIKEAKVHGHQGHWKKIQIGSGQIGYVFIRPGILSGYPDERSGDWFTITASSLRIRKAPESVAKTITILKRGKRVRFIEDSRYAFTAEGIKGTWIKVQMPNGLLL